MDDSLIVKLSIGFNLGRASVSLALDPLIYFMLAPVTIQMLTVRSSPGFYRLQSVLKQVTKRIHSAPTALFETVISAQERRLARRSGSG